MSHITIPFLPEFEPAILAHIKVMTCRTKRLGSPGDIFAAFGVRFILTHVFRVPLEYVATDCWEQEGCHSIEHFQDIWRRIHPRAGFDPAQTVWAHCWKAVQP